LEPAKPLIISLLATPPGHPRKALYQHSFPFSQKWGYLRDRDTPIVTFEDEDIRWLHSEGVLDFTKDDGGRRCVVLREPHARDPAPPPVGSGGQQVSDPASPVRREPPAKPYAFEQLLKREVPGPDLVFHLHIPKAGGVTVAALLRQNEFFALDFDMNTNDFFWPRLAGGFF
jgi:hypothetical protein